MISKKGRIILAVCLVLTLTVVGCTQQKQASNQAEQTEEIKFGYVNWPGVTVKTEVVKQVLETIGYKVTTESLGQQVLFKGMDNDEIDAFLGNWMPTMMTNFKPYKEKGTIVNIKPNVEKAVYKLAVPEYVWEAGVKSISDLHKHADKFDHEIVGLEAGNDGNEIMKEAIENNTYNLEDWKVVASSTGGMLSAVERATKTGEWIAFPGWEPHWMNVKYDIKYLEDPENIWGESSTIYTAARPELEEESPNFYKFLENFEITSQIQSKWILEYQKKERPAEEAAEEWIKNNIDVISSWLDGVKTVDGKDAVKVIKNKFK
ncbi:ABC transporter substrate-binding protein [Acetohalobium arabaticum]|uniref:Substrate-binding region of ABC-type glycine betaine transport system n=1 Tax=Acetohalobium arabaticum (strain ATCC 49924 / DSM 5501 / Z-7288) TaxID=574087 RepID=D9QUS4_ACEAZ|nr:ABC transporter substrate-binding protein [Acetohalobium arabaticum]ADL11983.1 Substrate-binding region of ABC-type glycine betaine transport system [Acetohalobium arabaticum DSM 5501]